MHKDFSDDAWADYTYWIMQDKKTLKKINQYALQAIVIFPQITV